MSAQPSQPSEPAFTGLAFSTLGCSGASLEDVVALANRHEFTGLEVRAAADEFVHTGLTAEERSLVREQLQDSGLRVLALTTYVRLCVETGELDTELTSLTEHLQLAKDVGAAAIRVFMNDDSEAGDETTTPGEGRALARIAAAAPVARQLDVSILVETHDSHSAGQRVNAFLTELDRQVPDHRVGVIWDTAHTWTHQETPEQSLALLRPWLHYLQIKDVAGDGGFRPVPIGAGAYPIAELLAVLARQDWSGWASLEWERKWHPELPSLDEALPATRSWLRGDS